MLKFPCSISQPNIVISGEGPKRGFGDGRQPNACYSCGQNGHMSRDCPKGSSARGRDFDGRGRGRGRSRGRGRGRKDYDDDFGFMF